MAAPVVWVVACRSLRTVSEGSAAASAAGRPRLARSVMASLARSSTRRISTGMWLTAALPVTSG